MMVQKCVRSAPPPNVPQEPLAGNANEGMFAGMGLMRLDLSEPIRQLISLLLPYVVGFALLSGLIGIIQIVVQRRKDARLLLLGITSIDKLSGRDFERLLAELFRRQGFSVCLTPYCGDDGCDVVIEKSGRKAVVQAKRAKGTVGIKAIQQVVASKAKYGAADAYCVTNSRYTSAAKELARVNKVLLWDRDKLIKELDALAAEGVK